MRALWLGLVLAAGIAQPQVVLRRGQPDPTDLKAFASTICAGAKTPQARAEAIWRYFLTDGRFVKPGFWYHIAGWAYEEPRGEVLDPLKLLNSYGFGLCYHIAPLLEAVFEAAGFEDARVWFLTGHTVAEVLYDGAYHYFDSDMMGYNTTENGFVASVAQLEANRAIFFKKDGLSAPWYPADVRANAIGGLADLFSTRSDNFLFPDTRYPQGHRMDLRLRPGEKLIRFFAPERSDLFYLPYKQTAKGWEEFPQEIARYNIRTEDGPRSQKDARRWGTGRLEYRPAVTSDGRQEFAVASPYVIIDAAFTLDLELTPGQTAAVSVSTDGRNWQPAGRASGPRTGLWSTAPQVSTRSNHGARTAVSGKYSYLCAVETDGKLKGIQLTTRVQLNPRTLPALEAGRNEMVYRSGQPAPLTVEIEPNLKGARFVSDGAQGYWIPSGTGAAEAIIRVAGPVRRVDVGGRFLDLSSGMAPDKFTAETRPAGERPSGPPAASIAWSSNLQGPFQTVWEYTPRLRWLDGREESRLLRWPEVDRSIEPDGADQVFVRYRFSGLAADDLRLAVARGADLQPCAVDVTHVWREDGVERQHVEHVPAGERRREYAVTTKPGAKIDNVAVSMECRP